MDKKDMKRQYNKETYEWLKEHHLCTKCKKQDAYTINGKVLCYECSLKRNKQLKKYNLEHKEKARINRKEKYEYYKQFGICTSCHRRTTSEGRTLCDICLSKNRNHYYAKRVLSHAKEDAIAKGMCSNCLKEKAKPGYKVCENCYDRLVQISKKADRSHLSNSNKLFFIKNY